MVIFTDALSVLSKLQIPTRKISVRWKLPWSIDLAAQTNLILQWTPVHCGIQGNEQANRLAK